MSVIDDKGKNMLNDGSQKKVQTGKQGTLHLYLDSWNINEIQMFIQIEKNIDIYRLKITSADEMIYVLPTLDVARGMVR